MAERKILSKFALEKKIVEMIDDLERSGAFGSDRAEIIATAIRNLYEEQKTIGTEPDETVWKYQTPEQLLKQRLPIASKILKKKMSQDSSSIFPFRNVDPDLRESSKTWEEETDDDEWFKKEELQVFNSKLDTDRLESECSDMSQVNYLLNSETKEQVVKKKYGVNAEYEKLDDKQKEEVDKEAVPKFRVPTKTDIYSIEEFPKGTGSDGLIWNMHNRILPVKFLLHVIAWEIYTSGGPFVRLDYIKDTVMVELESFTNKINDLDVRLEWTAKDYKVGVAFPDTYESAENLPKIKKYKGRGRGRGQAVYEEKVKEQVKSSIASFLDRFLGKPMKEEGSYSGACFEMGLLVANVKNEITLTPQGLEFVKYENPVITCVIESRNHTEKIFSNDEVAFIIKNIIPRFDLERILTSKILEQNEDLLGQQITSMLSDEQKDYVLERRKKEISKETEDKSEQQTLYEEAVNKVAKEMEKELKGPLSKRSVNQKATATTLRLVELGLLRKRTRKNPPPAKAIYSVTDLGKGIYERILSKN